MGGRTQSVESIADFFSLSERYLVHDAFLDVFAIIVVWMLEHAAKSGAAAQLEAKKATLNEGAFSQLLNSFCDAVVRLDGDLNIAQQAPALANLLFMSHVQRCLQGRSFLSLVAEEDL